MSRNILLMLVAALWSVQSVAKDFSYHAKVEGMVCAFCAYSVDKKISALPGVDTDTVHLQLYLHPSK